MAEESSNENIRKLFDKIYRNAVILTKSNLDKVRCLALGFNINIDFITKVTKELLDKLILRNFSELKAEVENLKLYEQKVIEKVDDLLVGMLRCMRFGIGDEWKITNRDVYEWINNNIKEEERAIGGQVGIMANVASTLSLKQIIINAPVVPEIMAELLKERIFVVRKHNDELKLISPDAIATPEKELIHWIFEFSKGFHVDLPNYSFTVPNSSRFIATYDPVNSKMIIDWAFSEYLKSYADRIDAFVISGFQLLEANCEAQFYEEKVNIVKSIINTLKKKNSNAIVKYELASLSNLQLADLIKNEILPYVDIISLNENELYEVLKREVSSYKDHAEHSWYIIQALNDLFKETTPNIGIHLHTFDVIVFYLNGSKSDKKVIQDTIYSSAFGTFITSVRAHLGREPTFNEIEKYLTGNPFVIKEETIAIINGFKKHLKQAISLKIGNVMFPVYITDDGNYVIILPVYFVEKPKKTVGLGDTCSIGQLISFIGLMKKP